jgi:hypothetical protein
MPFPLLPQLLRFLAGRETREGWPLLTIETEANGDSKRTNEKGSFLGWFVELVVPVQEIFCFALAALIGPVQNIFVLNVHRTSIPLSPSASKLGRQPCWVACLLVCVSVVGNAKNSAAEKDFFYQPISLLRPNFSPSYYTRTAPDDDNFCLFLWLLALDLYLLYGGCILYDVGKNSTIIFSAKACTINNLAL